MLTAVPALSPEDLAALARLEQRVVAADGGRLKLEWAALREGRVAAVLAHEDGALVGFLGVYAFGPEPELAGAVDPSARRRGLGGALLDAVVARPALLVVPTGSAGGRALALSRGAVLAHREQALVLDAPPGHGPEDPRTSVRRLREQDVDAVRALLRDGFSSDTADLASTLVVEHEGALVGTLRVPRDGATVGVYGFVVADGLRGRGIGRDVLRRVCRQALAEGAEQVALEVAVDNPGALHLYTSTGFRPVAGEDYHRLSAERAAPVRAGSPPSGPAR